MSIDDRRIVNRKPCAIPIRFILVAEGSAVIAKGHANSRAAAGEVETGRACRPHEGETENLSERGVAFKSSHAVSLGQHIELFFTLPTELSGRIPEDIRCIARVVHVDPASDPQGNIRVGAAIERFERMAPARNRGN
jgi:PilZ domain